MTRDSRLGALEVAAETSAALWAESSSTFGIRAPIISPIDHTGFTHAKIANPATVQYLGDGAEPILGVMGGSFKIDMHLPGHGTTTAGAISLKDHETILGWAIGRAVATGAGTTFTGGTAAAPTTTSSGVWAPGQIDRAACCAE